MLNKSFCAPKRVARLLEAGPSKDREMVMKYMARFKRPEGHISHEAVFRHLKLRYAVQEGVFYFSRSAI